jgi:hypothetical protein
MNIQKVLLLTICAGFFMMPVFASTTTVNSTQLEQITSQAKMLQMELKRLQSKIAALKSQLRERHQHRVIHRAHSAKRLSQARVSTMRTKAKDDSDSWDSAHISQARILNYIRKQRNFLPFDLDVPGTSFVSTGPYVGVPIQYSGSNLIVNTPSVNTDVQLLSIRKAIHDRLIAMHSETLVEPDHSHLLLSGVVEGEAGYLDNSRGPNMSNIDVTNVSLDLFFIGPSSWTLGFVELNYDNGSPISSVFSSDNSYRVSNSRVYINKAFITIGDFAESPFYASLGQFYVPFGTYSSVMISDTLPRLLARTKARSILIGCQPQSENTLFASVYIFRGDSSTESVSRINNGGINVGYKFVKDRWGGAIGMGVIGNMADSAGMQQGDGLTNHERIVHRVPGYNLRGILSVGEKISLIAEYVSASTAFNINDMSYNGHGAQPSALDMQAAYSFYILDNKPSSVALGYARTREALAIELPLNRYSLVLNTSLWRNTLQSIELRRDREYAASYIATSAGNKAVAPSSGKADNAITAQFDYYF